MNKLSEKTEIYFLKEYSKGKAENIVSSVETYFVSGWITFDDAVIISHFAGYIMYSYVIAEIEENAGDSDGYSKGEAKVQRTQPFFDSLLVEILKSNFALFIPDITKFRTAEYSQTIGPLLNNIISIDHRNVYTVDFRSYRCHFQRSILCGRFFESNIAAVDIVGYFRLQEMTFKVDTHKDRAEIAYLVVILHLVYGDSV